MKPRHKLVARVSTEQFRALVASGELHSPGWSLMYRRPGNTLSIGHARAYFALFSHGDDIFLTCPPERRAS